MKNAVQQKTGKRRIGEAKGSEVEVSSIFFVLFLSLKRWDWKKSNNLIVHATRVQRIC